MSARIHLPALALATSLGTLGTGHAGAEIVFLKDGSVVTVESAYAYAHPSFRSVVFNSPESRQVAILPPAPVFVAPPPLIWRAPSPFPAYPPAAAAGFNSPARPSNRDVTTYNLQRAHGFSQELYYRDAYRDGRLSLGGLTLYPWLGSTMPAYAPVTGGSHPSNRDNTTYNLERAHRFSMDVYKKP